MNQSEVDSGSVLVDDASLGSSTMERVLQNNGEYLESSLSEYSVRQINVEKKESASSVKSESLESLVSEYSMRQINVEKKESASSVKSESLESLVSEYSVRQVNVDSGGQVLDCKVCRDEETGLPRVEMVFSINPFQSADDDNTLFTTGGGMPCLIDSRNDVTVTSVPSDADAMLVSPRDVFLVEPPSTHLRSDSAIAPFPTVSSSKMSQLVHSAQKSEDRTSFVPFNRDSATTTTTTTSTSRRQFVQCDGDSFDKGHTHTDLDPNDPSDDGRRQNELASYNVDELKKQLERRNIVGRLLLLVTDAADGRDDRVAVSLFLVITLLFILLWKATPPIITAVSLICFAAHLIEFLLQQPAIDQYILSLTYLSSDEESRLETMFARMYTARRCLCAFNSDLLTLKRDRPVIFMLIAVSIFYLTSQLGRLVNGYLLAYLIVMVPALVARARRFTSRL